ncbi:MULTISPECIES: hypothetical protein [unclassified Microbacterium]|uniref:hypothetical protein n=1 Tax=unclassified Microbacterium TaxID=2609290 RepID=UPI003017174D
MAAIAIVPIVLNDIDLKIAADNYEASVSKVELVPTTPTTVWRGMTPAANIPLAGTPVWAMNVSGAQDHATASSLSQYTQANAGTVKTVTLKPKKGTTVPTYSIDVLILATKIGGDVDAVATFDATFPCQGQPVRTVA